MLLTREMPEALASDSGRMKADGSIPVAVISTAVPPSPSGQSRVLEQVLGADPPRPCTFLTEGAVPEGPPGWNYVALSPARFSLLAKAPAVLQRLNNLLGLNVTIWRRSKEIVAALSQEKPAAIIACSGSPFDLPAGFLAARRLGVPFVAYLFDDPVFQWLDGPYRLLARFWERVWGPLSDVVLAPNEVMRDDFASRVPRANVVLVRNPASDAAFARLAPPDNEGPSAPRSIVYTGSVYHAQGDAFRNLIRALDALSGRYRLDVYSSQSEADFATHGVQGPHVFRHDHVADTHVHRVQRDAAVLFLPLAFDSGIPEVIRSSAPAKMAEYLASGRPILVHAPKDSFVASFFRQEECGVVVDEPDPARLAEALIKMADDALLRATIAQNAARVAPMFRADAARKAFSAAVEAAVRRAAA